MDPAVAGTSLSEGNVKMDSAVAGTRLLEGNVEMDTIIARTNLSETKKRRRKGGRRARAVNREHFCNAGDVFLGQDLLLKSDPSSKPVVDTCIEKSEKLLHSGALGTLLQREKINMDPEAAETRLHEGRTNVCGAKKQRRKKQKQICAVNSENCCDAGDASSGQDFFLESNTSSKPVVDTCIAKNVEVLHSGAAGTLLQSKNVNMDPAVAGTRMHQGNVEMDTVTEGTNLSRSKKRRKRGGRRIVNSEDLLLEINPSSKPVADTCMEKNEELLHSGAVGILLQGGNKDVDPSVAETRLHQGNVEMNTVIGGTNLSRAKKRRKRGGRRVVNYEDLLLEINPSSKPVADICTEKNEELLHSGAVGILLQRENENTDPSVAETRLHQGNVEMNTVTAGINLSRAKKRRRRGGRQTENCCDAGDVLSGQDLLLESIPSSKPLADACIEKNEKVLHCGSVETLLQNETMEMDPTVSKTVLPMNKRKSIMTTDDSCDPSLHSGSVKIILPETNMETGPTIEGTSLSEGNIDTDPTADASIVDQSSVGGAKQEYVQLLSGAVRNGSISASNIDSAVLQDSIVLSQSPQEHSKRTLLILDVNGVLADIVSYPVQGANKPDTKISNKALFKRPFCDEFLQFCFERFHVAVWSSRAKSNVERAVDFLMGPRKHQLLFCWNQSHCTVTGYKTIENRDKPLVLKELRKLWDKGQYKGQYNETNTLLVDDSPYKALRNPLHTGIFPCPYRYRNSIDNSLAPGGRLCRYLERLSESDNVQKFVKENPIGQKPISEVHDSWSFYAKIVGREVSETLGKEMNGETTKGAYVKSSQAETTEQAMR